MLSAEAARLAALEVLCPTQALADDANYPTLAGSRVLDSRTAGIDDVDRLAKFTPVLALYTPDATATARGPAGDYGDYAAIGSLEIVAELAVIAREDGEDFVDAMAGDDWEARLTLAALCSQVRKLLLYSEAGVLFRRVVKHVTRINEETFAVPQIGARWHRVTMRLDLELTDDSFDDAGGLPKPISGLFAALPETSIARARLAVLADHFAATNRTPLEGVDFATPETPTPVAGFETETD